MCNLHACTALVHDQHLAISPSRTVAGHEPEKTNEFLQAIARAVQKKVFPHTCMNIFQHLCFEDCCSVDVFVKYWYIFCSSFHLLQSCNELQRNIDSAAFCFVVFDYRLTAQIMFISSCLVMPSLNRQRMHQTQRLAKFV